MSIELTAAGLAEACGEMSDVAGLRLFSELEPVGGPGTPVKPAVYEGGLYQTDKRWASPEDSQPAPVVVIDNVPSQANRLEDALYRMRSECRIPVIELDLSSAGQLPVHLPRSISSLHFPHRNADAYLRDAVLGGVDFVKSVPGAAILDATPWNAGALLAWFPQSLLFGFWQSHLGTKKAQTKHARAWNSEIIGWYPATTDTRVMGLKGDPLNLNTGDEIQSNREDRSVWVFGKGNVAGGSKDRLSEMGHGQVPFMKESDAAPAGVSFARITQLGTVSFAQLRRVSVGASPTTNAAARALLVSLGLYAHVHAFSGGFCLRSGADLTPVSSGLQVLGGSVTTTGVPSRAEAAALLAECLEAARRAEVPLDGWGQEPLVIEPKDNLLKAIASTWPSAAD